VNDSPVDCQSRGRPTRAGRAETRPTLPYHSTASMELRFPARGLFVFSEAGGEGER
jgi:hypothetical protein